MLIPQTEWQRRKDTLMEAISCAQKDIRTRLEISMRSKELAPPSIGRRNTIQILHNLLTCLGAFGKAHFDYFHNEVFSGLTAESEQTSADYPPEYVLSVILDQISFDLEAIEQAANQRLSHNSQVYDTLAIADEIARLALQPAMAQFQLEGTLFVTYFQKSASIRVIPYASVALIGIPYTTLDVQKDFLAIPHEVAHYLYWHGKLKDGPTIQQYLTNIVNGNEDYLLQWLEEIFADVYGCLVAGPALALSFQDLQMRRTPSKFETNDGEHPVPILRPDIYTKILEKYFNEDKKNNNKWGKTEIKRQKINWASEVNQRWIDMRGKRSKAHEFKPKCGNKNTVIAKAISKQPGLNNRPVDRLLQKILDIFATPDGDNIVEGNVEWWQDYVAVSTSTTEIYKEFSEQVTALSLNGNPISNDDLCKNKNFGDLMPDWLQLGQKAREQAKEPKPPEWLPVLHAGGWVTRGPVCEGSGTCGGG